MPIVADQKISNNSRTIISQNSPLTQSLEAGLTLARFLGIADELPLKIPLFGDAQLILSSKKDSYYYMNLNTCSCPAGANNRICNHQKDVCEALRTAKKSEAC